MRFFVIPVKTGIQLFQHVLDPGFRRGDGKDDFLGIHQKLVFKFSGKGRGGKGPQNQTHPVGLAKPASLQAPLAGPEGKSS